MKNLINNFSSIGDNTSYSTNLNTKNNSSKNKLNIFNKNINNNFKTVPFNTIINSVGEMRYIPSTSKEWINSVYYYNNNTLKNLPTYDNNINKLILAYFNMYFNYIFIKGKKNKMARKSRRLSFIRIHVSKSEVKHTNNKAILTIHVFNKEKLTLLKKIKKLKIKFFKKILLLLYLNNTISVAAKGAPKNILFDKILKIFLRRELVLIRKYKLKLSLNDYKFKDKFLLKLGSTIKKIYNKNVEFNIVNLKSMVFNSDLFIKLLGLKIKNRKANILKIMQYIIKKVSFPKVNLIQERSRIIKSVNFNLIENKYKNVNLNVLLNDTQSLDQFILDLENQESSLSVNSKNNHIVNNIFDNIKYKNMGGIRLEAKGRLTRRNRADRALFKLNWKGGLKNIDSSFKGLSTVNYRGDMNPNLQYSMFVTKRRIGAYAVKGWISGK